MNKSAVYIQIAQMDTFLFGIPSILVKCKNINLSGNFLKYENELKSVPRNKPMENRM